MLLNYLKLSLRLLARNPFFTFINVSGLAVGFASFFILWQHSTSELKADQFHKDFDRIARVGIRMSWPEDSVSWGYITFGVARAFQAPMIADDFPQVESFTRVLSQGEFKYGVVGHNNEVVISVNRKNGTKELFKETHVAYADPNLFEFFSLPLTYGAKENVLKEANTVALSSSTAHRYFENRNPIGEIIQVNDTTLLTVTGIFRDLPHQTHLEFDVVISNVGVVHAWRDLSTFPLATSYIKLNHASMMHDFESDLNKNKSKYFAQDSVVRPFAKFSMFLQPLKNIALETPLARDHFQPKSRISLRILQSVSVLILFMAWINYINLSISKFQKRMKEVATRKMSGAMSSDFVMQFISESVLMHVLAFALAFTLIQLVRVQVELLFGIHTPELHSISFETWILFSLIFTTGILTTSLFPVIVSRAYNPRSLLVFSKKKITLGSLPSLLTIVQYTIALILTLCAFMVYLQLHFILNKDLGVERNQVIVIDAPTIKPATYLPDFDFLFNKIRSTKGVKEATFSCDVIGGPYLGRLFGLKHPSQDHGTQTSFGGGVDESYIPFNRIHLIAGRNFVANDRKDVLIVSRYATKRMGYKNPQDAVGDVVESYSNKMQIIGVIDDFHYWPFVNLNEGSSENSTGQGICLTYKNGIFEYDIPEKISVKIEENSIEKTIAEIKVQYALVFPGNIFNWYFLDDYVNRAYDNEVVIRNQILLFMALAIGISCLGVLAMMIVRAEQKTKEIGIRKVLGAQMIDIGRELLRSSVWQVIISIVIALPMAYYLGKQYLQRYSERITFQLWHFVIPVMVLLLILFVTIASVLYKAAKSNPVESLKYE